MVQVGTVVGLGGSGFAGVFLGEMKAHWRSQWHNAWHMEDDRRGRGTGPLEGWIRDLGAERHARRNRHDQENDNRHSEHAEQGTKHNFLAPATRRMT